MGLLSTAVVGCKGSEKAATSGDSLYASKSKAQAVAQSAAVGPRSLKGFPGKDTAATLAYLDSLDFSLPVDSTDYFHGDVPCDALDNKDCDYHGPGKLKTRKMLGIPEGYSQEVDWNKVLDPSYGDSGYIVAKLTNEGKRSTHWRLGKDSSVYLWVGPAPKPTAPNEKIVMFVAIDSHGHMTPGIVAHAVQDCADDLTTNTPPRRRNAHVFQGGHCQSKSGGQTKMNVIYTRDVKFTKSAGNPYLPDNSGFWVACGSGCCEAMF
jgi:hypothetical protein